jgi:catechol 2,3-dioxygenase-like lactoylglutathione lyase family enzyme
MTPEFNHCTLHVRDLDQSIAFYESYCGFCIAKEHGQGRERTVWMARARMTAANSAGAARRRTRASADKDDVTHYGFAVPSRADVEAAERGRREGRLFWEPQEFPPPTGYLCAIRDPSGYIIEFC